MRLSPSVVPQAFYVWFLVRILVHGLVTFFDWLQSVLYPNPFICLRPSHIISMPKWHGIFSPVHPFPPPTRSQSIWQRFWMWCGCSSLTNLRGVMTTPPRSMGAFAPGLLSRMPSAACPLHYKHLFVTFYFHEIDQVFLQFLLWIFKIFLFLPRGMEILWSNWQVGANPEANFFVIDYKFMLFFQDQHFTNIWTLLFFHLLILCRFFSSLSAQL